jgi:hypothetical protein
VYLPEDIEIPILNTQTDFAPPMGLLGELLRQFWYRTPICLSVNSSNNRSAAMYVIGGIRATFYIGVEAGGPAAYW